MKIVEYQQGMSIDGPTLVLGMPNEVYHAWPDSISKSGLDRIARSPAHYARAGFRDSTRAMEIGTALHTALLEPDRFKLEYVQSSSQVRTAAEYKEKAAKFGGDKVLTSKEWRNVIGMQDAAYSHGVASGWLKKPGYREASLFVNDPETGILIRTRPDIVTDCGHIIDVKKTQDARYDAFSRSVNEYSYHTQSALYSDALEWATGKPCESFRFIAIEESEPHGLMVYRADATMMHEGRKAYREAIMRYVNCLDSGIWLGYEGTDDDLISLPDWRIRQIENESEVNNIGE